MKKPTIELTTFLAFAAAEIREHGYTSRTQARDAFTTATADAVFEAIRKGDASSASTDRELAERVVDWALSYDPDWSGKADSYREKLCRVAMAGHVSQKTAGYAASMIGAFEREQKFKAQAEARAEAKASTSHVGTEGERLRSLEVRVVRTKSIDGRFGPREIVTLERTSDGSELVWFTGSEPNVSAGEVYTVDATVKQHKEFRGVPQTVVTRVSFLEHVNAGRDYEATGEAFEAERLEADHR